jgi:hypothetical protein
MRLPFRQKVIRLGAGLLCGAVIALAIPNAALAWHGDDWRPRHFHGYYRHGGWGWGHWYRPAFLPALPPFGVGVYPGYYAAPYPYYAGPPAYVPAPPAVSFGFAFGR